MNDPRSQFKKLYAIAVFNVGNVVYYKGNMHEVVKRFYRQSERAIMYDIRNARTNMVVQAVMENELMNHFQYQASLRLGG